MNDLEAKKALLNCPGDTIQEAIDEIGMSQAELAERMGRTKQKLNELIKGKAPLTKKTALKLEYVLGIPASLWMNLEKQYQEELLEIEQLEFAEDCKAWLNSFPLTKMKELKLVSNTTNTATLIKELLKFFRVASPKEWKKIYEEKSVSYKVELKHFDEPEAISVWLRIGEIQAEKIELASFNKKLFRKKINDFEKFYKEGSSKNKENWKSDLQQLCADCGVILDYTNTIPKNSIYLATRWVKNGNVPLIQVNQDLPQDFWFNFMYQVDHIIYQGKKEVLLKELKSIQTKTNRHFAISHIFSTLSKYLDSHSNNIKNNALPIVLKTGISLC